MSGSLSTDLSYESLREPSERDTSSIPDQRTPSQAAEQPELPPDLPDFHAPDTTPDPRPDNRLSLVSAVSLEPRRRSRHHNNHHHHSRHSHIHRELAHMLSVSSRDAKELRRGLSTAFDKLDQSRVRASHAEKLALDMRLRVREAEEERVNAMRQASTVREELGKYKALLDNAHGEIRRAQQMLQDQEQLRYDAEASAARARDSARLMKQRRLVDLAREHGRKIGYNEGIQAGQRIGYHDGNSSAEDGGLYQNEGARFREMFDESRYRLDEFDQSPPFEDTYLNPVSQLDTEGPLPTPLPRRQVYPRLQGQLVTPGSAIDATNLASEARYNPMSPMGVQRTSSGDSSSTTTLPVAPATFHVSSRAPPPMPTIPEVSSTEVGSTSYRSKSPRDSPRMSSHIQPAFTPRVSTNANILPSEIPVLQGGAGFEPPPGSMDDTPSGLVRGSPSESGAHTYQSPSPRRAFDDPSVLNNGMFPDISQSPVHENFSNATGAIQSPEREYFAESIRSPAREHFESSQEAIRGPAREHFETPPEAFRSPAREHFETPSRSPAREHFETPLRNPARENFEAPSRNPAREHFETSPRAISSPVQERFSTNHSPRVTRVHPDSVQFVDDLRNPESSMRPSSRPGGPPPRRDGPPPRHRPIPQMPAPLAPQSGANAPYAYGSHSTQRRQPSEYDNQMPRDASLNAASNQYTRPSQIIPNSAGHPTDSAPGKRMHDTSSNAAPNHYTRPSQIIPNSAERPTDRAQGQRTRGMSPRISSEQLPDPGATHDPRFPTAPPVFSGDSSASRPRTPQNAPPRVHVQIPPTRYYTPNSASPRQATPTATGSHILPPDIYSLGATSPNSTVRVSGSANQSPIRYPPTLYNEPNLQRQPTPTAHYEQEGRAATPVLPIPSRDRATSPGIVRHPADPYNRSSYIGLPRTVITSPHTPTDTLPVRPPSVSPRPSPAEFAQPIPPSQGAPASFTPRRAASPNPLPRGVSPAPLPRAPSPAPLPIRSPSAQSTRIHRSASDVSLPGAPGSPYMHYNPNQEADIAVLASSSQLHRT